MILPLLAFALAAAIGSSSSAAPAKPVAWGAFGARAVASSSPRTLNLLVVPMRFAGTDSTFSVATLEATFTGAGTTVSVRDFFRQQSKGLLDVSVRVLPWGLSGLPRDSCGRGAGATDSFNTLLMTEVASRAVQQGVDLSKYDNDQDGDVDGLILIFSGKGYEQTQNVYDMSSSQFATVVPATLPGGAKLQRFLRLSEITMGRPTPPGTASHEICHLLGLPDLYDQNYSRIGLDGGLGAWDLMSHGSHGLGWDLSATGPTGGWLPTGLGAFSRIALGWISPKEIDSMQEVRLAPGEAARLWTDPYRTRQFLYLENRERSGVDSILPGPGLLVTRVRPHRVQSFAQTSPIDVNSDSADMGVVVLEASGKQRIAQNQAWMPLLEDLFGGNVDSLWDDGPSPLRLPGGVASGAWVGGVHKDGADIVFRASPSPSKGRALATSMGAINGYAVGNLPATLAVPLKMPVAGKIVGVQPVISDAMGKVCTQIWGAFTPSGMGTPLASVCDSGGFGAKFKGSWHTLSQPIRVAAGDVLYTGFQILSGVAYPAVVVDPKIDTCWYFEQGHGVSRIAVRPKIQLVIEYDSATSGQMLSGLAGRLALKRYQGILMVEGGKPRDEVHVVLRDLAGRKVAARTIACDASGAGAWRLPRMATGLWIAEAESGASKIVEVLGLSNP